MWMSAPNNRGFIKELTTHLCKNNDDKDDYSNDVDNDVKIMILWMIWEIPLMVPHTRCCESEARDLGTRTSVESRNQKLTGRLGKKVA